MARLPVLFICVLLHSAFKSYAKDTYHKLCSVIDLCTIINEISRWECLKRLFYIYLLLIYKIPPYKVLPERTGHAGFEPAKCRNQNPVPYRLANAQYFILC